ncbi:MAG: long-chain fatty acid--CoA ligase [Spirochaetes bacterium]|nr:long-chain fatty acid--CoA ligase [Spirochaetota bacterium]
MNHVTMPDNLVEMIEGSIARHSGRNWAGTKNKKTNRYEWITYGEGGRRIDNVRAGLAALGIGRGDSVGIIGNNSAEWAIAYYSTLGLGASFVPMYEAELRETWKYIINDSGVKALFVANGKIHDAIMEWKRETPRLQSIIIIEGEGKDSLARLEETGKAKPVKSVHPDPDEVASLIYTSGTTGEPKGVLLTHRNIMSNVHAISKAFPMIDETDRSLSILPWAHSYGQTIELNFGSSLGGSTGFAEKASTIIDDILLVRPTILVAVPKVFTTIYTGIQRKINQRAYPIRALFERGLSVARRKRLGDKRRGFVDRMMFKLADSLVFKKLRRGFGGNLRFFISSGASLSSDITGFFFDIGLPVYEGWGMTELSPAAAMNSPLGYRIGSVGRVIDGVTIGIDRATTGPESREGEIIIHGPNVMKGYHNKAKATAETLTADGGLRTGDMGYLDDDGFVYITGRIKEQFKLENGKFVSPVKIEEEIKLNPIIDQVFVYGLNMAHNVCLIYPNTEELLKLARGNGFAGGADDAMKSDMVRGLIVKTIEEELADKVGSYEIPRNCLLLSEGFTLENCMLTQSLKLKRNEIIKRYKEEIDSLYTRPASCRANEWPDIKLDSVPVKV